MSTWQAWLVIVAMFAVPSALLWRWRHDPSRPQARIDMEEAARHAAARNPKAFEQAELDAWRARGRMG